MIDLDDLKTFIKSNTEKDIYDKYLLGQNVWFFQEYIKGEDPLIFYDKFKRLIAKHLQIHFHNISIVGSAKTKFSFSPNKNFKPFNDNSDFDIILVSDKLYNFFWDTFYEISQYDYLKNYSSITSNVFRKFVSIKDTDSHYDNDNLKSWQRQLTTFKTELQLQYKIYNEV